MDFPTPEEEYELMYGEELDMMEDFNEPENAEPKPVASTQQPAGNATTNASIMSSPALSQISRIGSNFTPDRTAIKKTSTPFIQKLKAFQPTEPDETDDNNRALMEIQNIGVKRKRRLEDLFGDIYDIEEDDLNMKKYKTDEDRDFDTIDKIIEARQSFQKEINPLKKTNFDRLEALHKFKKENLSKVIPKFPFMTISKQDDRLYVRTHSEDFEIMKLNEIKAYDKTKSNFFGSDRESIWNEANDIILKEVTALTIAPQPIMPPPSTTNTGSVDLWVEKYRPKKYIDLLSDESTNRSLLQWLKLWDKAVFKREVIKKNVKPGEFSNFNKKTGRFEQNGGWKRKQRGNLNTELDSNHVPIQKVALLVGKPGLGKTTLAHVIARHAGYVVREMNASDDRTVDSFKQALENGTQMTSVLNQDNRPNCIILDEIDGAPLPSIEFLIRFVSGQVTEKSKKGTNKKKFILKRPIICICNDLYGANLRNLRQIAFVVNFQQMDNSRLADRLMHIADKERVKTDLTSLLALADKTGGDIRSCLSMIQFFACSKKQLTLLDVMRSNIGQKDQHKNLFSVWASIFQIQRPKKVIKTTINDQKQVVGMSDMSPASRMEFVLKSVSSCGEYDRLIQGVFENYLRQKMHDPNLEGIVEANRWFCFDDIVQNKINSLQNYAIYPYLVYGFASWHFSFSSMAYPQITYPQKSYEVLQKTNTTKQVFNSLKKGIASSVRGIGSGHEILIDSISLVKIIISPEIRSVSMHLLTEKEKIEMKHTVDIITDLGLTFNQLQSSEGTYVYKIEPDIEYLSGSFGEPQSRQMSYWSKQIIAREVELEKMRRAKPKVAEGPENASPNQQKSVPVSAEAKALPNHLQRLIPKAIKSAKPSVIISKDFFGRVTSKASVTSSQAEYTAADVLVKGPIWFKFKVGYNNAVRKDITLADLL